MPRRFTMQEKWDDPWYRKLSPVYKCFWEYIYARCNYSGIWICDFETAEHYVGAKLDVEVVKVTFEDKYLELEDGKKWFLLDYLNVQHKGVLNPNDRSQKNVYKELMELGLLNKDGTLKPLTNFIKGAKNKEIETEKDIDTNKDKILDKVTVSEKNINQVRVNEIENKIIKEINKGRDLTDNTAEMLKHPNDANLGMEYDFYGKPIHR